MARFFRRKKDAPPQADAEPVEASEQPAEVAEAPESPEAVGVVEAPEAGEPADEEAPKSVEQAVERTRRTWFSRIGGLFRRGLDDELWVELEEMLIAADTGVETTVKLLDNLKARVKEEGIRAGAGSAGAERGAAGDSGRGGEVGEVVGAGRR